MNINLWIAFAGVLTSGVASSFVTYKLNLNKEQKFVMRQKAEALFLATDEFGRNLSAYLLGFLPVARGDLDYNQMLASNAETPPSKRDGGYETMAMLIRIYFPELEPKLDTLLGARDRMNEVRTAHKQAYKEGEGVDPVWVDGFTQVGRDIDQAIRDLQAGVVSSARRYAISPIMRRA